VLADDAEEQFRERLRSLRIDGDWHAPERTDAAELFTLAQAADLQSSARFAWGANDLGNDRRRCPQGEAGQGDG
jgi:hypothetical protein